MVKALLNNNIYCPICCITIIIIIIIIIIINHHLESDVLVFKIMNLMKSESGKKGGISYLADQVCPEALQTHVYNNKSRCRPCNVSSQSSN